MSQVVDNYICVSDQNFGNATMNAQTAKLQEQAREAYKRKDYTKAQELFSRGIGRSPSLQLHDGRAACLEKMDNLSEAIKDAKKSIQIAREDPTGYVRAGRILVKMERKKDALEIYSFGLKNVKHVGQGFEVLRKVHLELMTELSPAKSVDPLTMLPRELAEQILSYLNFKQLMNTCMVSKGWSQFIRRSPNLWHHLDLTLARRKVKNVFVSRAINIGRAKLKAATLNNLFDLDKALAALARHCPLEELTLRTTGMLTNDIVEIMKSVKTLKKLRICKGTIMPHQSLSSLIGNLSETLETLVCDDLFIQQRAQDFRFPKCSFPNLQNLDLSWSSEWPGLQMLLSNLPNMPNLRILRLHQLVNKIVGGMPFMDIRSLSHLSTLDLLLDIRQASHLMLPSSLKSLSIGTWRPRHANFFNHTPDLEPLQWSFPELEELRICAAEVPFDALELALRINDSPGDRKLTTLHTLSMTASDVRGRLTKETLSHPRLAGLKHLSLESSHGVDDSHLSLVAISFPELQSLNVSGTDVTGAGIKEVVNNGLKKLIANNCRFVGIDAIQWARTQGVQVENRNTDAMTGGKKLRY